MKKAFVILSLIVCSCSTAPKYYSFDNALGAGIKKIGSDLPEGTKVAILDFKSDNENLSAYIIEEMYDKLVNFKKLAIMERGRTDTIALEVGYQLSGEVDDSQIVNIGRKLGADYVVTGQIAFSGDAYRLRVFAIDIEKGRRVASSSLNINRNDRQIKYLLGNQVEPAAPNSKAQPAAAKPVNSLPKPDTIVSPSEAKKLFEQILNGNYPPILICNAEHLRNDAKMASEILFTANFARTYYFDDDNTFKIIKVGDGWGSQEGNGTIRRDVSLVFSKNPMRFVNKDSPEEYMSYQEMLETFDGFKFDGYNAIFTSLLIVYTGSDGNKYLDFPDF